ncbi:MAG: hypothetical protein VX278_10485, partial [Myxococcota bacterium]|nr:hypothetical protein [Myxococcota bacterium]
MLFLTLACTGDKVNENTVEQVSDWCDASLGQDAGSREFLHDFAHAHTGFNLFGPTANWLSNNATLSQVIANQSDFGVSFLDAYANQHDAVCSIPIHTTTSPESSVEMYDDLAYIQLGSTEIDIPSEAHTVVIDMLRADHDSDLDSLIGTILIEDTVFATQETRRFLGFPSQDDGWTHYEVANTTRNLSITATGASEKRIFFITPARLAPKHARLIAGLRLHGLAGILGHNIFAATAESSWEGIGEHGLLWRSAALHHNNTPWPDIIPADSEVIDVDSLSALVDEIDYRTPIPSDATRENYGSYNRSAGEPDGQLRVADMQSALINAYGILD